MLAEDPLEGVNRWGQLRPWLRLIGGLLLGGLALWLVMRNVRLVDLAAVYRQAHWGYALLGIGVIVITIATKAWRWQMLFYPPENAPPYSRVLKALIIGFFLNQLLPFARLGDIARIFLLGRDVSKAQVLGTLVVEKVLDMLMIAITVLILLPILTLPDIVSSNPLSLVALSLGAIFLLYLLAYQTSAVIRFVKYGASFLPSFLEKRIVQLVVSGLEGLATLRDRRVAVNLLLLSIFITILSLLTPLVLFPMFELPFGLAAAALLNITLLVGSLPSSIPGSIGIFEGITILTLKWLGAEQADSILLGYAFIYHIVVVLPVILGGSWLAIRGDWQLSQLTRPKPENKATKK